MSARLDSTMARGTLPMNGICRPALAATLLLAAACGARSGLEEAGASGAAGDAAPSGPDAATEPDRDCPRTPREGAPCAIEPIERCPECPEATRICFYPAGEGLLGCSCVADRWACEPAECDGWGPECTRIVRTDTCEDGWGCGACCSLDGRPRLGTWCACSGGARPVCQVDVPCSGP